jgi:uncharacterized membrane protein
MMRWSGRDIALAGSIAANLLLAGFVVGVGARVFKQDVVGPPPSADVDMGGPVNPLVLLEGLDPDERDAVRRRFREEARDAMASLREAGEARQDFYDAMAAEPFDADAARDALARSRRAERMLQDRGDALMIEAIAGLSADERAQFVARVGEWRQRVRGGGFRPDWNDRRGAPGARGDDRFGPRVPGRVDPRNLPSPPDDDHQ